MDFGAREILILLGILVIVAILLDGIRRVGRARRGKLRTSPRRSSRTTAIFDDDDDYPGELPGRGARVVQVRDERSAEEVSAKIKRDCDYTRNKFTAPFKARSEKSTPDRDPDIFDDGPADAGDIYPESLETESSETKSPAAFAAEADLDGPLPSEVAPPPRQPEPFTVTDDDAVLRERSREPHDSRGPLQRQEEHEQEEWTESPRQRPSDRTPHHSSAARAATSAPANTQTTAAASGSSAPSRGNSTSSASLQNEILILHLMAPRGRTFEGEKLLEQMLDHGLRYGEMRIFHRHETLDGAGPVHFSVANSVKPGVFDLNTMDQFSTPGVTFIMRLDGLDRPLESFDTLINTAVSMSRKLEGELKDDTRSAFTKQTVEHYRQRIIDFTRRSFTLTN